MAINDPQLHNLRLNIADRLCKIEKLLPSQYKLTLICRNIAGADKRADIIVSNDDEAKAVEAARRQLVDDGVLKGDTATVLAMINDLRADEGDSIEILCDNPEGPPNNAVRVSAGWTNYDFERFEGDTLEAALTAACFAKAERSGK